jgi:nucleotide-binding universal stress UspA family protein
VPDAPRRILAPTDFSAASLRAVQRAAHLARAHGAELRLLHVLPSASRIALLTRRGTSGRAAVSRAARMALQQVAEDCARMADVRPSLSVLSGTAHAAIARAAGDDRSDLIVLGATGEHERLLAGMAGGTALRLLASMPADLLVVRRPPAGDYSLQLVGVDLGPRSGHLVTRAVALLPASSIALATCYDLPHAERATAYGIDPQRIEAAARRSEATMRRELAALALARIPRARRAGRQVLRGDPRKRLPEQARQSGADCLTLGASGSSRAGRRPLATFGTVVPQIVGGAPGDVLVIR